MEVITNIEENTVEISLEGKQVSVKTALGRASNSVIYEIQL